MRVLDLSRLLPGPFATFCLQGLGAEVLKVESPGEGDPLRRVPPQLPDGTGAWFSALNRGKRSVVLNLKEEAHRERFLALCAEADVVVEGFRPGVMARLGLAPASLVERFPKLVVASLSSYGQTGPLAQLPGHDLGFVSLAGMLSGPHPSVPRFQWGDLAAGGLVAALRILGAVHAGRGGWLDIAMLDGLIGLQPTQFAQLAAGAAPDRILTGANPRYRLYACADGGWVSVAALEENFLAILAERCPDTTEAGLRAFFLTRPRDAWLDLLGSACVTPVLQLEEVQRFPGLAGRGLFTDGGFVHPPTGPVWGLVPALGEHGGFTAGGVGAA